MKEWYCPTCDTSYPEGGEICPEDQTRLVLLHDEPVDEQFRGRTIGGRFTLGDQIGVGGMGAVYRATQHSLGRDVAVKLIRPDSGGGTVAAKRFMREARLASMIDHPGSVVIHDFGQTEDGHLYLVMELVAGRPLDAVLEESGPLSVERAFRIGIRICDTLERAHGLGIIHRDLKPHNVMLLDRPVGQDLIKVLDFGLAKSIAPDNSFATVTTAGAVCGTPAYMAPEVALAGQADGRADLYSLGALLYQLLSGSPPFQADTAQALMLAHVSTPVQPLPTVTGAAWRVVERLLAKQPEQRFGSAAMAREGLRAALEQHQLALTGAAQAIGVDQTAPAGSLAPIVLPAPRRRWPTVLAAGVVVAALTAAALVVFLPAESEPSPKPVPSPGATAVVDTDAATPAGLPTEPDAEVDAAPPPDAVPAMVPDIFIILPDLHLPEPDLALPEPDLPAPEPDVSPDVSPPSRPDVATAPLTEDVTPAADVGPAAPELVPISVSSRPRGARFSVTWKQGGKTKTKKGRTPGTVNVPKGDGSVTVRARYKPSKRQSCRRRGPRKVARDGPHRVSFDFDCLDL